jgi:hypothetical protein
MVQLLESAKDFDICGSLNPGTVRVSTEASGLRNSLFLNGAKNARNLLYSMSLTVFSRAFLSLSGMPVLSSR